MLAPRYTFPHYCRQYVFSQDKDVKERNGIKPLSFDPMLQAAENYVLICNCWPGGEIKERMKFQDLELLH